MTTLPEQIQPAQPALPTAHMVVCGDDALAERVASDLHGVYGADVRLVQSEPDDGAFAGAGVRRAAALALVYDDDQTNVHAALRARRLNPRLRLVIRLYNRKLGTYLQELLDPMGAGAGAGDDGPGDATTVLSDADTAAPALVAAAVTGSNKVVQADGLLLRSVEIPDGADGPRAREAGAPAALCTLALLPVPGRTAEGPRLLPDDDEVAEAADVGRRRVVLESVVPEGAPMAEPMRLSRMALPLRTLFSRRLRWTLATLAALVGALALASVVTAGEEPGRAAYLTVLDVFQIDDPAIGEPLARKVLQILAGVVGLALLPVLIAGALEALGTFRTVSTLRRPPRLVSGHVVLLGLGKIGTRVLRGLRDLGIPVVCVESDPYARGVALARGLHVPTVIGDVTDDETLDAAKVSSAQALLAVTSNDTTNLEAVLGSRALNPSLRVVLRLRDDDFATAVYRALRDSHPQAQTRSRSVSALAAPAFAGAMMGRDILGAIPVERGVLVLAVLHVAGHPELERRTVAQAFRPGAWRVLALDLAVPDARDALPAGGRAGQDLVWDPPGDHLLLSGDRVVVAATREGLAELLR